MSPEEIRSKNEGYAIESVHTLGDSLYFMSAWVIIKKMALNLIFYPLEVISTNRILKTPLIQEGPIVQINLLPQLTDLFKRGGFKDLFRGFIP